MKLTMRLRGENSWVFVLNSQLHANASHCKALYLNKKALFSAKINMVFFLCGFEIEKSARLFILIDLVGTGKKAATVTAVQCK